MIEKLNPGDKVKVIRAIIGSSEQYLRKTGVVVRAGTGFKEAQFFVKMDLTGKELFFYGQELSKLT